MTRAIGFELAGLVPTVLPSVGARCRVRTSGLSTPAEDRGTEGTGRSVSATTARRAVSPALLAHMTPGTPPPSVPVRLTASGRSR